MFSTANLAVAGKRPVVFKSVPAAGNFNMNICNMFKRTNAEDVHLWN